MAGLRWSPQSVADLDAACEHLGKDSRDYARFFAQSVVALAEQIARYPRSGRVVPEYQLPALRERILQPYRIVYQLVGGDVELVAIVHGARDFVRTIKTRIRQE